jgi:membrane fusion protein
VLFRKQVLDEQARTGLGDVIINQPRIFAVMTFATIVTTLLMVAVVIFGTYSRKETVSGYLAPTDGIATVYASRGGVVSRVGVSEGDLVRAGDPLISLTMDGAGSASPQSIAAQIVQTDDLIREARLQHAAQETLLDGEREHWEHTLEDIAEELQHREARESLLEEQVTIAFAQLTRWEEMAQRGLAPQAAVDVRRQNWISAQANLEELRRIILTSRSRLLDAGHSLELLPTRRELELSRTRSAITSLEQSKRDLERAAGYTLSAPIDGRIASLQANVGLTARGDQPLVAIVPDGTMLRAHILVPTRSAGFIDLGQEVRIRIDAFPYQRFGAINGYVESLSTVSLTPSEVVALIQVQEAVYRLTVDLPVQSMSAYGVEQPLQPGMTLSADIIVDERPFWRWFVDPVLSARKNS